MKHIFIYIKRDESKTTKITACMVKSIKRKHADGDKKKPAMLSGGFWSRNNGITNSNNDNQIWFDLIWLGLQRHSCGMCWRRRCRRYENSSSTHTMQTIDEEKTHANNNKRKLKTTKREKKPRRRWTNWDTVEKWLEIRFQHMSLSTYVSCTNPLQMIRSFWSYAIGAFFLFAQFRGRFTHAHTVEWISPWCPFTAYCVYWRCQLANVCACYV